MTCNTRSNQITLEASTVTYGKEHKVCVEPVTGLVGGEYFLASNTITDYYIWFTVDSTGTDPVVADKTGIQVDLPASYTLAQATALIKAAVETEKAFYGLLCVDNSCIVLESPLIGAGKTAPGAGDSGFTVTEAVAGFSENLGKTKDGITVNFEAAVFDVKSDTTGEVLLDQIIQGTSATMDMALLEVTKERLEKVIGEGFGDVYTPSGGESLVGFGTSRNFKSTFDSAGKLILHPIRLDASERSEDVTFWKTLGLPSSINYQGTDTKALSVSFNALNDESKPEEISVFAVGDSQQFLA